jgi:hypothetical protein
MIGSGVRLGNILDWSARGDLDVACPSCAGRAVFTSPYDLLKGDEAERAMDDPRFTGVKFSSGFALIRFPDHFPWRDPNNPYLQGVFDPTIWGVISCGSCAHGTKHMLSWPGDAFYQRSFSFGTLWAYTRKHALAIRKYVIGPRRRYADGFDLNRVPKEFLRLRNRESVVRGLDEMLARNELGSRCRTGSKGR